MTVKRQSISTSLWLFASLLHVNACLPVCCVGVRSIQPAAAWFTPRGHQRRLGRTHGPRRRRNFVQGCGQAPRGTGESEPHRVCVVWLLLLLVVFVVRVPFLVFGDVHVLIASRDTELCFDRNR
jgi:hypothetical protein